MRTDPLSFLFLLNCVWPSTLCLLLPLFSFHGLVFEVLLHEVQYCLFSVVASVNVKFDHEGDDSGYDSMSNVIVKMVMTLILTKIMNKTIAS